MKKLLIILSVLFVLASCTALAAKFTVNQSGVVKNSGRVVSPSNTTNQNFYNNYNAQDYVSQNIVNSQQVGTIEFVMDYSGSMANWIGVAKRSMSSIVSQIPGDVKLGFRVFGHDNHGSNPSIAGATLQEVKKIIKKGNKFSVVTEQSVLGSTRGGCAATSQVTPIYSANASALLNGMNSVDIGGSTPLVYGLDRAVYQDFANFDQTSPKKIVLITDGGENCGGNPCEFAKRLMAKRSDVHIDVVLVSSDSRELSCLASTTGGHFYTVDNLSDFSATINQSIQTPPSQAVSEPHQQSNQQYYEFIDY